MRNFSGDRLALPMYDLPELAWATDALGAALLDAIPGGRAGARERPSDLLEFWRSPALLLAQTCGYPLVTRLRGQVRLVATPCYAAPGCDGPAMRSAVVVRSGDPATDLAGLRHRATCAINGWDSNSGMNLLRAAVAPLARGGRFFRAVQVTGSHVASLGALRDGSADVASIDCVTVALLRRVRPSALAGLRVLDWTPASPGLPLITAPGTTEPGLQALRAALDAVLQDPALADARAALLIERFALLEEADYRVVGEHERQAGSHGYPVLQ